MAKDEFDIGQMMGSIMASLDNFKETMTRQHGDMTARMDMYMNGQKEVEKSVAVIEKKVDASNYRLDDITDPDGEIMRGIKYAHDYNDNKKKINFLGAVLVGVGVFLGWLLDLVNK